MSDVVTLARTARESLARGLNALQADPSVPPQLVDLAAAHRAGDGRAAPDRELGRGAARAARAARRWRTCRARSPSLQSQPPQLRPSWQRWRRWPARSASVHAARARRAAAAGRARHPLRSQPQYAPVPGPAARGPAAAAPAVPAAAAAAGLPAAAPATGLRAASAQQAPAYALRRRSSRVQQQRALRGPGRSPAPAASTVGRRRARGAQPEQLLQGPLGQRHRRPRRPLRLDVQAAEARARACALRVSLPGGYEFEANAVVRWRREPSDGATRRAAGLRRAVHRDHARGAAARLPLRAQPRAACSTTICEPASRSRSASELAALSRKMQR